MEQGSASMRGVAFQQRDTVRLALLGCGGRGQSLLKDFLSVGNVQCTALYDNRPDRASAAAELAPNAFVAPTFEAAVDRDDVDFVIVATPWEYHVPMSIFAMQHGKDVGVEVPAALTIEDCWSLVATSERTRRHCMLLENCCYGRNELTVLQMVRKGLFGTITHGEASYIHDLRTVLFDQDGEGAWRRAHHTQTNANLYPTHGLGPVAWYMGIHDGDRFESLVSMSSLQSSLSEYAATQSPSGETYVCGDMNTSIIRTALGRTILLQHDVVTPRPYTRHNMIQGSHGAFADFPARVYVDGRTEGHKWDEIDGYLEEFKHPLWAETESLAAEGGHGGMDFVMAYRLVQCLREGLAPDIDVYDAAAWSAPFALSKASVAAGGAPQEFPDFTRGNWRW